MEANVILELCTYCYCTYSYFELADILYFKYIFSF